MFNMNYTINELSKGQLSLLNLAVDSALKSPMQSQHGCILALNNTVVTCGKNTTRSLVNGQIVVSCHAEIDTIHKYLRTQRVENKTLYKFDLWVIRVGRKTNGELELRNSKPCKSCLAAMKIYGLRKIYYSLDEKTIACSKIKELENTYITKWTKNCDRFHTNWRL